MDKKKTAKANLFVFWKYDQFPYVLGGLATSMDERGFAYVPTYRASFKPVEVLPPAAGSKIKAELVGLKNEYRKEQDDLHKKFMEKRDEIIKI